MRKIDIHAHYGKWPFVGHDATVEDIERTLVKYEMDAIFLSSSKAIMYDFIEGNRETFEDIADSKGLYGYVVINSNYPGESLSEVKKYMNHPKFIGVKYHPDYCGKPIDHDELKTIYKYLEDNGLPVLIHTYDGISSPLLILNINKEFPGLKVIAAHMGGSRFDLGCELAKKSNNNVFLEICATDIDYDKIRQAVDTAGAERVLFGTDYSLFDPSYTIGAVESSRLSEREKMCIYRENALRIFTQYKI